MSDITIESYVDAKKILTVDDVKKMPVGSTVVCHSFDRRGCHQWAPYTIVMKGKHKVLRNVDFYGRFNTREITIRPGRECFTEE